MSEQNTIPAEMLDAATKAMVARTGFRHREALEAALRAAGVPALLKRMAELEAALRDRICEGCDKLMANVGQLHLCGCRDQRNLCDACNVRWMTEEKPAPFTL